MTILVHHLEDSRSHRVLWLLEELDLSYEVVRYPRDSGTRRAPSDLKDVHPLGKSPIIEDADAPLGTIPETGAIVEYLVERAGGRLGAGTDGLAAMRYRHFLHYAEASLMPAITVLFVSRQISGGDGPWLTRSREGLAAHLEWIESQLTARPFFAGDDLTAADIMMSFPLEISGAGSEHPHIVAWLARIHARPAYARAIAKGGAYSYA